MSLSFHIGALKRSDKRKTETAEMGFLRHVARYTRRDEISDLTTRSELQIFNINDKIENNKWNGMTAFSGWTLREQPA
jgi:hypothetical protein